MRIEEINRGAISKHINVFMRIYILYSERRQKRRKGDWTLGQKRAVMACEDIHIVCPPFEPFYLQVAELPATNIGHLFYLQQNALVKSKEPHYVDEKTWIHPEWLQGQTQVSPKAERRPHMGDSLLFIMFCPLPSCCGERSAVMYVQIEGENFLECMQRQREALRAVEQIAQEVLKKKCPNEKRKPRVRGHAPEDCLCVRLSYCPSLSSSMVTDWSIH